MWKFKTESFSGKYLLIQTMKTSPLEYIGKTIQNVWELAYLQGSAFFMVVWLKTNKPGGCLSTERLTHCTVCHFYYLTLSLLSAQFWLETKVGKATPFHIYSYLSSFLEALRRRFAQKEIMASGNFIAGLLINNVDVRISFPVRHIWPFFSCCLFGAKDFYSPRAFNLIFCIADAICCSN